MQIKKTVSFVHEKFVLDRKDVSLVANLIVSVCEDSLMTDETIRTVQENLFKLKETAVNTLHLFEIFRRKIYQGCEQVWK